MKYCVSIANPVLDEIIKPIQDYELAEIRLDLTRFTFEEISLLCDSHYELIFTFRASKAFSEEDRMSKLYHAIEKGAAWIDLDIGNSPIFLKKIKKRIEESQRTKLITSYHNYKNTPTNQFLFDILLKMTDHQPDLKKIVCTSLGQRDNERIVAFNSSFKDTISFNMGKLGESTRVRCLFEGAPFTYVSLEGYNTAPGQMTRMEIESIIKRIEIPEAQHLQNK